MRVIKYSFSMFLAALTVLWLVAEPRAFAPDSFFAFRSVKHRTHSLCGGTINLPTSKQIDKRLIGGAILFGIGWGLAGICPGPGLVLLGAGVSKGIVFVGAMVAGMLLFERLESARIKRQ